MSFGEWRGFARHNYIGTDVEVNIGREIAPLKWHMVGAIDNTGTRMETVDSVESTEPMGSNLTMPVEVAHTLYMALDRLFGQENTEGKVEALQAALEKEQARVDLVITRALGVPQRPSHRFDGVEGTS